MSAVGQRLGGQRPVEPDVDVLVVGCGPVGVMAALRCAQRGLSVLAIDRSEEIFPLPRAVGMDAEIQGLFDRAGLGEPLRAHSTPLLGAEFVNAGGERVVGMEVAEGTVGSLGYPAMITFDQPGVERFLRRAAVDAGVEVQLGVEARSVRDIAVDVEPDVGIDPGQKAEGTAGYGVRVEFGAGGGHRSVTARWLIGADGARSSIRAWRGLTLVDQGFDQTWLVIDTTLLDPDLPLPRLARQICDPARVCTFVPGTGSHRRWEFRLQPGETREAMLELDMIQELLAPWGTTEQLAVDRAAVYRFHATVAESFRDGPVFLAGDAAHQMPPFNGQGMCTGLRDAENLSWKLATVADGLADDGLLDTYDEERRPHAAGQVVHSVDAGMLIDAIASDGEAALGSGYGQRSFPGVAGKLFIGQHPRVGHPLPAPSIGDRPPSDGWLLLRQADGRAGDVPELWPRLGASVLAVGEGTYPGLVDDGVTVVVRPDRSIAAVTTDLASITDSIAAVLRDAGA